MGTIPFTIKSSLAEVGEDIFVLGYPLTSTMGEEIKLTNGIISSRTGYEGDVTQYQFSAPVQPGNSGGPLFDKNGNLIGVVSAKHTAAENVSYGIKSKYLIALVDQIADKPKLATISTVKGKSLSDQTKILKQYVFLIRVSN